MSIASIPETPVDRSLAELGLAAAGNPQLQVKGITASSGLVSDGFLFAALPGVNVHGANFAGEAAACGAAAILTDRDGASLISESLAGFAIDLIVVDNPRKLFAEAAAKWFGRAPEISVAVTGTNGKSSVVSMCRQIWELLGKRAASLGTLGVEGANAPPLRHTTPGPVELHGLLAQLHDSGVTHVAMEASSHGLVQHRLAGTSPAAAAFTNLTHDHLDYHGSMDSYFDAKAMLFNSVLRPDGVAVVWTDSERGRQMANLAFRRGLSVLTMGDAGSDVRILSQIFGRQGQGIKFEWMGRVLSTELGLPGEFQARNALTAAALAVASGEHIDDVAETLPQLRTVNGRLELAATRRNGARVYVDYAHTPDALDTVMKSLKRHHVGRLIVVFGAGGERDRTKRAPMGEAVARIADLALITDDNPRDEDPGAIRAEIMQACLGGIEVPDRAEAILRGVDMLTKGDVLLIAGKGHETGQEIGGIVHPFNDVEQASMAVEALDGISA